MTLEQTYALMVAGTLVPFIGLGIKLLGLGDVSKLWVEGFLSLGIAYLALVYAGKIPFVPSFSLADPMLFVVQIVQYFSVIFALAYIVYQFFQERITATYRAQRFKDRASGGR